MQRSSAEFLTQITKTPQDRALARTNYSFEKRQKELAKIKKKEEKKQRKLEKQDTPAMETDPVSPQEE